MQVAEFKRLQELEAENQKLNFLLALCQQEVDAMQELLAKSGEPRSETRSGEFFEEPSGEPTDGVPAGRVEPFKLAISIKTRI